MLSTEEVQANNSITLSGVISAKRFIVEVESRKRVEILQMTKAIFQGKDKVQSCGSLIAVSQPTFDIGV